MALDFDTEDDARSFFGAYRGKMFDLLRLGTVFRVQQLILLLFKSLAKGKYGVHGVSITSCLGYLTQC